MGMLLEDAKQLYHGQIVYHAVNRNADGSPQRWKVNGMVKTWKRSPDRVRVPIKHGLYSYDYITEDNYFFLCLNEEDAMNPITGAMAEAMSRERANRKWQERMNKEKNK